MSEPWNFTETQRRQFREAQAEAKQNRAHGGTMTSTYDSWLNAQAGDPHPDGEPTARELAAGFTLGCREPHGPEYRCFDCATDDELAAAVPPHPDANKPVPWGEHPHGCDCGDCP